MCKDPLKIKSISPYGVKESFVPCGRCAECRKSMAIGWSVRLRSEIDYYRIHNGYNIGFLTLTYNDGHLPLIPEKFFDVGKYKPVPCFSYPDVRKFFDCIRGWFWRDKKLKSAFRFFVTCEYGEKHHRPHYHALIMYHPSVDPMTMYNVCSDAWCGTDYVIPLNDKNFRLKRFNHGIIAPFESFVPRDNYACGNYVAKYVCKDLAFYEVVNENFSHLTGNKKALRELRKFFPFHRQSLGFGRCALENKSPSELVTSFIDGLSFFGDKHLYSLPRYMYGKLLFTPRKFYDLKLHKWRTFKLYTKFFYENRELVYRTLVNQRLDLYARLAGDYWKTHLCFDHEFNELAANDCKQIITSLRRSNELSELAKFDVLYFGLPPERCHVDDDHPEEIYFARFNPCADLSDYPLLDESYYAVMSQYLYFLKGYMHLERKVARNEQDAFIDEVRAFFNSMR